MEWVISLSPKSRLSFAAQTVFYTALIVSVRLMVTGAIEGASMEFVQEGLKSTVVALPFIMFVLAKCQYSYELAQKLGKAAFTDSLTGLPNRRGFLERAAKVRRGVLLVLDVDHFKRINDRHGHAVGDVCLQAVAAKLRDLTRSEDLIARFGGEEFVLVLAEASVEDARRIGGRLANGLELSVGIEAVDPLRFTVSLGAIPFSSGADPSRLIDLADRALYRAKSSGRARLVLYDPALDDTRSRAGRPDATAAVPA